ncbi:Atrnl1 [Symbiodinium necroappetens]|uniref:Atrnl1 protein n=1 Tax=Symbiodinium necroappetens TaxID=1628268 RepID=A0A812NQN2_9DINO|nr:Atrnl1 [Symbiodinium necroappetens]
MWLCWLLPCSMVTGNWVELTPPSGGPRRLSRMTAVWDPVEKGLFLFGGLGQGPAGVSGWGYQNYLYFYSVTLNLWSIKSSDGAPVERFLHTAVLDPVDRVMYVFGGQNESVNSNDAQSTFTDLFAYDVANDTWTELTGSKPRSRHTAVWDSNSHLMIVFGGISDDPTFKYDDVEVYDPGNDTWTSPAVLGAKPVGRFGHMAVWDSVSSVMLMCCGRAGKNVFIPFTNMTDQTYNDLWSFSTQYGWTLLVASGSFTQRRDAGAIWDSSARKFIGYGGQYEADGSMNTLFIYSNDSDWSEYALSGPVGSYGHAICWLHYFIQRDSQFHKHQQNVQSHDIHHDFTNFHFNSLPDILVDYADPILHPQHHSHHFWHDFQLHDENPNFYLHIYPVHLANVDHHFGEQQHHDHFANCDDQVEQCRNKQHVIKLIRNNASPYIYPSTYFIFYLNIIDHQLGLLSLLEDTSVTANASNASSRVLGYVFAEEKEAAVHAWALDPSSSDAPLTSVLTLDADTVGLAVPPESLAQVAELAAAVGGDQEVVLLTISTFPATSALNVSQRALVADPVRVNFRTAGGERLRVQGLRQPLELRFQYVAAAEGGRQLQCAYWDEENSRWSRDGVQGFEGADEFVCLANHLTLFGVVLDAVAQAFRCSTASDVLSAASFQNMSRTQWLAYPASIFSFVFLGIFLAARALPQSDVEAVLLVNRAEKKVTWEPDWRKHRHSAFCCWCLAKACDGLAWLVSTIFEFQATDSLAEFAKPQEATVSRCIALLHSQKAGADRKSISAVLTSSGERKLRRRGASESPHSIQGEQSTTSKATQATAAMVQSWDVHSHGVWAVNRYLSASWCRRVMILLPCLHPWVTLALLSLFKSHTMRAALVVLKLSTSAFANALFFTTAAQGADSDDECAEQASLGQKLLTATVVGISSACMSDVLVICLALLQRRRILIRELWTEEMKARQLRRWRIRQRLFWCVWTLAFVFSILYILSFLANVSEADAAKWLESSGVSFLQDLLLKPALMAMGYATLTTFVLCCSPRVKEAILIQWIQADEDVDESVAEDTVSVSLSFPAGDSIGVDETESDHEELVQSTFLGDPAGLDETESDHAGIVQTTFFGDSDGSQETESAHEEIVKKTWL